MNSRQPSAATDASSPLAETELYERLKGWFLEDRRAQSAWYKEAESDFAFHAGHGQWEEADRQRLKGQNRPCVTFNRIGPVVAAVVGMEVANRQERDQQRHPGPCLARQARPRIPGQCHCQRATTAIGAPGTALYTIITGTATIASLGTVGAGTFRIIEFGGALTLTHNATSLRLPGGANVSTAAGDVGFFISLGSGNWKCLHYSRADGTSIAISASQIPNQAITYAKIQNVSASPRLLGRASAGAGSTQEISIGSGLSMSGSTLGAASGAVIQTTIDISQSLVTDSAHIPFDGSAPLNTEGTQAFSRSFTPKSASSTIIIDVSLQLGGTWSTGEEIVAALYRGSTCIATGFSEGTATNGDRITFTYSEAAGSTSARTYSVRFGAGTGDTHLNRGNPTSNSLGGTPVSSMKITEIGS